MAVRARDPRNVAGIGGRGQRVKGRGWSVRPLYALYPQPSAYSRSAPGFPRSITNDAAVSTGAPGRITYGTVR